MSVLSDNIKKWRTLKGYTLAYMGQKLGVTEATFQRYESGLVKNIKYDHIIKIAEVFNIAPQVLMGWVTNAQDPRYDKSSRFLETLSPEEKERFENLKNTMLMALRLNGISPSNEMIFQVARNAEEIFRGDMKKKLK